MERIARHNDLEVYKMAFDVAMRIFELSKAFPKDECYSLIDQIRRSSRSVCANIAEGFRKRKYPAAFVAKLSDAEAEAAETQVWLEFSLKCQYLEEALYCELFKEYDYVLGKLVNMMRHPEKWKV